MKKLLLTSLAISLAACSSNPFCNKNKHHEKMGKMMMKEMDANNDGVITKVEWNKFGEKKFSEIDTNNDKKITEEEMKIHQDKMKEKMKEFKKDHQDKK